jgi:hypothetical protein
MQPDKENWAWDEHGGWHPTEFTWSTITCLESALLWSIALKSNGPGGGEEVPTGQQVLDGVPPANSPPARVERGPGLVATPLDLQVLNHLTTQEQRHAR